jgi:hypothetical protein
MTYLALLWRQKSFAFFADPIAWQGAVDEAESWQQKAAQPSGEPGPVLSAARAELGAVHASAGKL